MRLLFILFTAGIALPSGAWSQDRLLLADRMFCDYVADFAPQIARNKIRMVPFLRLDEFDYFDGPRSQFLRRTAQEIYARNPGELRRSLDSLAEPYVKECYDVFDQD